MGKRKVNVGPLPEQINDYSHYEEDEVRWDRIIFVCGGLILFAFLAIYLLNTSSEPGQTGPAEQKVDETKPSISLKQTISLPEKGEAQTKAIVKKGPSESDLEDKLKPSALSVTPTPIVSSKSAAESASKLKESKIQHETTDKQIGETRAEGLALSATGIEANPASVLIVNSAISRAALSLTIKDNEPGVPLNTSVVMPEEGIIKVILFTEMNGLRGNVLYHEWYRNNVRQARVKIPVNVKKQRSYSSKYINAQMHGQWQVKVIDTRGEPYVLADFEVLQP